MKALVDNRFSVQHIESWEGTPLKPVYATYPDSARICEVSEAEFDVAAPLFWVDCDPSVVADQYWYDTISGVINPVVNAPYP
jgi:hypothetical protein